MAPGVKGDSKAHLLYSPWDPSGGEALRFVWFSTRTFQSRDDQRFFHILHFSPRLQAIKASTNQPYSWDSMGIHSETFCLDREGVSWPVMDVMDYMIKSAIVGALLNHSELAKN